MKISKPYKFYSDPGHAWLAVKLKELYDLNIIQDISSYSYIKGKTAYLEEDCDAGIFLKAAGYTAEWTVTKHTDKRHPIRSYDSFSYEKALKVLL